MAGQIGYLVNAEIPLKVLEDKYPERFQHYMEEVNCFHTEFNLNKVKYQNIDVKKDKGVPQLYAGVNSKYTHFVSQSSTDYTGDIGFVCVKDIEDSEQELQKLKQKLKEEGCTNIRRTIMGYNLRG